MTLVERSVAVSVIRANTVVGTPPLVPELSVHEAHEVNPIWSQLEAACGDSAMPPPFWAFPWPGGQALARYVLDHPEHVRGLRVLSLAAGGGLEAIAAMRAGAQRVCANDIDPWALVAAQENAALNEVEIEVEGTNVLEDDTPVRCHFDPQVILAGDVCYERTVAAQLLAWLRARAGEGRTVLLGGPARMFTPTQGIVQLATYRVPTLVDVEGVPEHTATVARVLPDENGP